MTNDLTARIQVRGSIISCQRCSLHSSCLRPVPFSGPNPNVFCILGEAPGSEEDAHGEPFVGPSGRLLRSTLGEYASTPSYLNAVCCYPARTPTKREIDACHSNLDDQLKALCPLYLMACGGVALSSLGITHRMGDAQGRWFWHDDGTWVLANWHPSAVLRSGLETKIGREFSANVGTYIEAIQRWHAARAEVGMEVGPLYHPPEQLTCIRCGQPALDWDRNRTGWCGKHTWTTGKGVVSGTDSNREMASQRVRGSTTAKKKEGQTTTQGQLGT